MRGGSAVGLVNMNGRIYDPQIGRMLSADPYIQDVYNTQSLNRYSYVNNNPLSATDPSGFKLKGLWAAIVAIVVAVVLWYVAPVIFASAGVGGFGAAGTGVVTINGVGLSASAVVVNAGIAGAASGAVTGGGKGALVGALSGMAFAGVGNAFGHAVAGFGSDNFSWGNFAGRVAAHGAVGGLTSVASGGKFLSGFLSAGVSALTGPIKVGGFAGNLVKSSVVGGFGSMLGGGKFQNGAVTGAFSYIFNEGAADFQKKIGELLSDGQAVDQFFRPGYHKYETEHLKICDRGKACTFDNVHSSVMATQVPGYEGSVENEGIYPVQIPVLGYIGDVIVYDQSSYVANVTLPGHWLYYGYIARYIEVTQSAIYLYTIGEGANVAGWDAAMANQVGGKDLFNKQDQITKKHYQENFGGQ